MCDIRTALKIGCEAAQIPYGRNVENGFTFHDLRHTFQVNARRAGIDKNVRMVIMGHSDSKPLIFMVTKARLELAQAYAH